MPNDNSASVRGKGPAEMLPARGNPFERSAADAIPMGGERSALFDAASEPRDLSAEDLGYAPMTAAPGAYSAPAAPNDAGMSPEDLAALNPSSASERDSAMGPNASLMSEEDLAAVSPSSHEDRDPGGAGGGMDTGLPQGAAVVPGVSDSAPGQAVPERTVTGGVVLTGVQAFLDKPLELSEQVGIGAQAYDLGENLTGDPELVKIFVPDGRLSTIWLDIEAVENQVASARGVSLKVAREMLDRLAKARNFIMADRANYEEAGRQLAEVKYRLTRIKNSSPAEHARAILLYLIVVAVLIFGGFVVTTLISGALSKAINAGTSAFDFSVVWQAMLWGAVGGLTGASYGLWVHVSRDQDYEPQYALWYYTNPPMGFILGAFMYIVIQLIMPVLRGGMEGAANATLSEYVLYFLCWAVGFQQNLAFSIANSVLKRLIPADEKADTSKTTTKSEMTTTVTPPQPPAGWPVSPTPTPPVAVGPPK